MCVTVGYKGYGIIGAEMYYSIQPRQHAYLVWFSEVSTTERVHKREVSLDYQVLPWQLP